MTPATAASTPPAPGIRIGIGGAGSDWRYPAPGTVDPPHAVVRTVSPERDRTARRLRRVATVVAVVGVVPSLFGFGMISFIAGILDLVGWAQSDPRTRRPYWRGPVLVLGVLALLARAIISATPAIAPSFDLVHLLAPR